ncbi:hypothetical protein AALO_G00125610 [Alosa alosa]|nr:hypothetical protein AALO_G00125610 [Alosa alosa]
MQELRKTASRVQHHSDAHYPTDLVRFLTDCWTTAIQAVGRLLWDCCLLHFRINRRELKDPIITLKRDKRGTMVNPGGSTQPPPVGAGSLSWKRCAGCGGKIADRFLLYAMDSYWHSRCLKCSCCQAQLGEIGTSCYTKSGMILCRNDYIRLFGNSGACSACGQSIPASELVMRAQGNVYHLKCFTCSTCRNRLVPGDRFHYINGSLFCEHDRPTALINGHLSSLQTNPLLPDQKVC